MPDAGAANFEHDYYRDLIQEVFLKPIRSVLIIDDEFPTLDRMLAKFFSDVNDAHNTGSVTKENAERVLDLMRYCRDPDRNWLVDFHDGSGIGSTDGTQVTTHLHQSDLLVLDYRLDGDDGDAEKAILILRNLARSEHFNLVVVYTQDDIHRVFRSIVLSLLSKWDAITIPPRSNVSSEVDKWSDENETILKELQNCVTQDTYLRLRQQRTDLNNDLLADDPDMNTLRDLLTKQPNDVNLKEKSLFKWLLSKAENNLEKQLSPESCGDLTWSKEHDTVNWIRTNRLFITVVPKVGVPAEQIPKRLLDALTAWAPEPPRLIMSKMRAELDARGVNAEDDALSDGLIQAIWLLELLKSNDDERLSKIVTSVSRYWEGLLGAVEKNVIDYAKRLFGHLPDDLAEQHSFVKERFRVDLQNDDLHIEALLRQNAYNCSKRPEGWHLTTGHVLKINNEYWVCLSPACDLVPNQKSSERYSSLSPAIPFKAVKLHSFGKNPGKKEEALIRANSNMCLFLKLDKDVQPFHFIDLDQHLAHPVWEEMFAANYGKFDSDTKTLRVARLKWNEEADGPACEWKDAVIITQLRYEYALNLLQRLGSTLSRVGLDFVQLKKSITSEKKPKESNRQADV